MRHITLYTVDMVFCGISFELWGLFGDSFFETHVITQLGLLGSTTAACALMCLLFMLFCAFERLFYVCVLFVLSLIHI